MPEGCDLRETYPMVRTSWPSTICPTRGLHRWSEGPVSLYCDYCRQGILYVEVDAYRRWTWYWTGLVTANVVSVLN